MVLPVAILPFSSFSFWKTAGSESKKAYNILFTDNATMN